MNSASQVPDGYKLTEVGVIPEDWDVVSIGDISDVKTGPFGSALHEKDYVDNGTPIITVEHLGDHGVDHIKLPMVSDEDKKRLKSYVLSTGDIAFSRVGSIDRNALIRDAENGWLFSGRLLRVRIVGAKANSQYLSYQFHFEPFKQRVRSVAVGQTMPSLNTAILKSIKTVLPSKTEQTAIANALSDADAWIQSLTRLIAKKRQIKQGTMQTLLNLYENGNLKAGWVVKKLGDVVNSFQNGYGFSASGYSNNGTPIVTMAQIGLDGSFQFNKSKVNHWRSSDFNILKSFHLKDGDVIIAMTDVTPQKNLIGRMTTVKSNITLLLNQRVGHLRIDESKINPVYLTTLSNMEEWRDYCIASASLGVQANIRTHDILNGRIIVPPLEEQTQIATILSNMDTEITTLETKLKKAQQIKQGMMQNLLTGRIRLL